MREKTLFQPAEENQRELQSFGGVQRHQRDLRTPIVCIGIAHQRCMIQELVESFAPITRVHGGIHQFP